MPLVSVSKPQAPFQIRERLWRPSLSKAHLQGNSKNPDCQLTQARLRCAYLEFNPDFKCPFPLFPFVYDQWALCSFTFYPFFWLPWLFNLFHHPHPPNSPPPNVQTSHLSKDPSKRQHAVEQNGLARLAVACSLTVWFSHVQTGVYTLKHVWK